MTWDEDLDGCDHEPLSTIIILTPFEDGELPEGDWITDYIAYEFPTTRPVPDPEMLWPDQLFEDVRGTYFEFEQVYYVSALYRKDIGNDYDRYGLPSTGFEPLYVEKRARNRYFNY